MKSQSQNAEYDRVIDWLRTGDKMRGAACCDFLKGYLASQDFQTQTKADLLKHITKHRDTYVDFLTVQISACKAIERLAFEASRVKAVGGSLHDIHIVFNECAMFSILLQESDNAAAPKGASTLFDAALAASMFHYLELAENQVAGLCNFLVSIMKFFQLLKLGNARIFLVDLPVGNSLVVRMLDHLLSSSWKVHILRASLSRNDRRSEGTTRAELLSEQIEALNVGANDIILYVDEWETGANFKNICKHLKALIPKDCWFFPTALLSDRAKLDPRFNSFCRRHDELFKQWGVGASDYRHILEPIKSPWRTDGYFFWSEKDRMAGFRKLQLHGAVFSSVDSAIAVLHDDREKLILTATAFLALLAPKYSLPGTPEKSVPIIVEQFEKAYIDYIQCKDDLLNCANDTADGGITTDMEGDFRSLIEVYSKQVQGRPANLAFLLAGTFMERFGSIDPADRYYFHGHAPTIELLKGNAGRIHELTLAFLKARIKVV